MKKFQYNSWWLMFGINNAFLSWFVYTTRVDVSLLEIVHVSFLDLCRKNCFIYIGTRNIRSDALHKDRFPD